MALCDHGYTLNWDCPFCDCCCGSGIPAGECRCDARREVVPAGYFCEKDRADGRGRRCARQCSSCGAAAGQAAVEADLAPRLDPATSWPFPREA